MTTANSHYEQWKQAVADRVPVARLTVLSGERKGAEMLLIGEEQVGSLGEPALEAHLATDARTLLASEQSETRTYQTGGGGAIDVFIETFPPSPTLLILGAVHVAQPLTRFAKALGFRVIVADAREKLATRERFPDADEVIQAWPDVTLEQIPVDGNTYVAILTHDPKFDEPALLGALQTRARYIGAVGSRKTNLDRRERLRQNGVSEASLDRIRGPIGLNIGASTPEEMAIAIMAEIIAVRHGRPGGALTGAEGAIRGRP